MSFAMKRCLFLLFAAAVLFASSCKEASDISGSDSGSVGSGISEECSEASEPEITVNDPVFAEISEPWEMSRPELGECIPEPTVELLGNPYADSYSELKESNAHIPWDIAVFDNKLFVGSGDYDVNSGPVPMKHYDLSEKVWADDGSLPDEAVMRFLEIGGRLIATGTDPKGNWKTGNYYIFQNGGWVTKRVIPKFIHNFDMIEFNGLLFAAGGALSVNDMITVSRDGGETFEPVPFLCESEITDNIQIRVYNLFVLKDELYAVFSDCSVYRFDDSEFVYATHWNGNAEFLSKVMHGDVMYFVSDRLFRIDNIYHGDVIEFPDSGTVYDVCVNGDSVYAAASAGNENGGYTVSVWQGRGTEFQKLFEFEYAVAAFSLAVDENGFYFGMGNYTDAKSGNKSCGDILRVEYPHE